MKSIQKSPKEASPNLFFAMLHIAMTGNVLVLICAVYVKDFLLSGICIFLFLVSWFCRHLLTTEKAEWGIHLAFISYLVAFTGAPFTHLVIYPGILLYPIVIGQSHLVFSSSKKRTFYAILSIALAIVNLFATHAHHQGWAEPAQFIGIAIVGCGLLLSLFVITKNYARHIERYQARLVKSREKVFQKNTELEHYIKNNLQLENFAHLASHELRTPMKNISNFMGLLGRKLADNPPEAEMVEIVNKEVQRMNTLIEALLELSLTTNSKLHFERITTHNFLTEIIAENFGDHSSSISFGTIPLSIKGNDDQLRQLFIRLIGNGLKFQTSYKEPQILIEGKDEGDSYSFSIHDNGIGIKNELKDRIFLIFKRLHTDAVFEGTGIGLAICKTIAERHGGRIWVEDSYLGGSVFTFTLAKHVQSPSTLQSEGGKVVQIG